MSSPSESAFQGTIGETYRESKPWWPQPPVAPKGAPNVVFIVLDDVGFSARPRTASTDTNTFGA